MLTQVRLQNFQSHKDTTLELGKLTMFTGGSNSGKSAALRGIIGMLKNEAADSYVTWDGSKSLTVTFTFDDGNTVSWNKGSGQNTYIVETPEGETRKYEKVGTDVPEEVASVLGLTPLVMEDGTKVHVNVHNQLESPFLVSGTNGQVAKMLGELTSASKIFSAVSEGNRRVKDANARKKLRREDLTDVRARLQEFESLDDDLALFAEVERLEQQRAEASKKYARLVELQKSHAQAEVLIADGKAKIEQLQPLVDLDLDPLVACSAKLESLTALHARLVAVDEKLDKLRRLEGPLTAAANVTGLDEAEATQRRVQRLTELRTRIEDARSRHAEAVEKGKKLAQATELIDKALNEAYAELTECPSCGQELSADEAKEHLLREAA